MIILSLTISYFREIQVKKNLKMFQVKADSICTDFEKLNTLESFIKRLFSILKSIKDLNEVQENT